MPPMAAAAGVTASRESVDRPVTRMTESAITRVSRG
jgi:hypothetical protein